MLNPISFRPGPVVFWTTVVYLALSIPLVIINESVPPPPSDIPTAGLNLTEAWLDLATLAQAYHPYNSKKNEEVRDWLLLRIQETLDQNGVSWTTELSGESLGSRQTSSPKRALESSHSVTVFNDMASNYSGAMPSSRLGTNAPEKSIAGQASYFEGTNILVYIRGTDDEAGKWWESGNDADAPVPRKGGTLVNAHYDSVSTGFGATDDGMGVISVLQLIKYFTTPGNQPKRGIVALLNNGEEDYLYGARAFGQSPLLPFVHTFLNLEGAGAGGRALLFRTSDQEVTAAYSKTKNPFGTVIASDSFSLGFIRSQTDYVVLNGIYGQRGLDLAFFKPRARYHTSQDSVSQTSRASLWHMLSASVHTMINLSGDTGGTFVGPRGDGDRDKVQNGRPSDGVWFDIFGKGFVLFNLRGMFAWSLTILIVTPLVLALVTYFLVKADKYYLFTATVKLDDSLDSEPVSLGGLKGFFRFPLALVFAVALTVGTAFLLRKINPMIIYSGQYSVWATMLSIFYFAFWLIMRGASFVRPSALHRGYASIWLFVIGWAVLVTVTVFEDRFKISAGYIFVFLQSALFLSTLITLVELFALPRRVSWAQQVRDDDEARDSLLSGRRPEDLIAPTPGEVSSQAAQEAEDEEDHGVADETTPLVGASTGENIRTTFATTYRRSISAILDGTSRTKQTDHEPYDGEQPWSGKLPSWTWLLQFLLTGPFIIILAAQVGLTLTDAVGQTGTDGSNPLLPYLVVAVSAILALLPITPFIHRVTHHIPLFLLVVFVGTLIYNLAAFPFSANNRFKTSFQQTIDLDTGVTTNHFHGIEEYVRRVIAELPSASGREIKCGSSTKQGIAKCSYDASAVPPNVGKGLPHGIPPQKGYADLVSINVTRGEGNKARFQIDAVNTKACFLQFKKPVTEFNVLGGSGWDDRFGRFPKPGVGLIKLWRRDGKKRWVVDVSWTDEEDDEIASGSALDEESGQGKSGLNDELRVRILRTTGLDGFVSCQWSDANVPGTIPALDEALQYAPTWAGITKSAEGLVEGKKSYMV